MAITKWNVWHELGSLRIKSLVRKTRYTPVKSSKAMKKLHNYVKNVCTVEFRVSPQGLSAEQRQNALEHWSCSPWQSWVSRGILKEEKQSSDWHQLGEKNNFLVPILAMAPQVFSHRPYLHCPVLYNSSSACKANSSHGWVGRMRPAPTGGFCERPCVPSPGLCLTLIVEMDFLTLHPNIDMLHT